MISQDIAVGAGGVEFDSLAGQIRHGVVYLATATTFCWSCVGLALICGDESRHSLHASGQYRENIKIFEISAYSPSVRSTSIFATLG